MLWPIIVPLTPKSLAFLAFGSLSWQAVRDGSGHDGHWEGGFCHSWGLWCNTLALCLQEAFSPLPLPHAHMLMSLSQIRSPWKAAWEQYFARSCVFMQVCPYSLYLEVSFAVYKILDWQFFPPFQFFEYAISLPSGLHCFWEVGFTGVSLYVKNYFSSCFQDFLWVSTFLLCFV